MVLTPREEYIGIFAPIIFANSKGEISDEALQKRLTEFKAEEPTLYTEIEEAVKDFPGDDFLSHPYSVAEITSTGRGVGGGLIAGLKKLAKKLEEELSTPTQQESTEDSGAN